MSVRHFQNAMQQSTTILSSPFILGMSHVRALGSQPHFWKSVRMTFTPPKWGLGSPLGLPKLQSSSAGVKTPRIEAFFISLESYQSVDVENGLHEPFGHMQHKLWQKERSGVKLAVWLSTTKSRELTWPWCVQVECDTPLENFRRELQVCFRSHPNQSSKAKSYALAKLRESKSRQFRDFSLGVPGQKVIWM
jgi:hypothetical protein